MTNAENFIYGYKPKSTCIKAFICPYCAYEFKQYIGGMTNKKGNPKNEIILCPCCWNHIQESRGVNV